MKKRAVIGRGSVSPRFQSHVK